MENAEILAKMPLEKYEKVIDAGMKEFASHPYSEASTDRITKQSGISKGLLFHYFGSKTQFYLCCLEEALKCLIQETSLDLIHDEESKKGEDAFFSLILGNMHQKMILCKQYEIQMKLVNMASRELDTSILIQKNELIQKYLVHVKKHSRLIIHEALGKLQLKEPNNKMVEDGFEIYTTAVVNRYLAMYQNRPEQFFEKIDEIQEEIKDYLLLLLQGIML